MNNETRTASYIDPTAAAMHTQMRNRRDRFERALTTALRDAQRGLSTLGTVKCAGYGCRKRILWAADSGTPRLCEACADIRTPFVAGRRTTRIHDAHRRTAERTHI